MKRRSIALMSSVALGALATLSMALGVMMVVAVLTIYQVVSDSFHNNSSLGYGMIVGAKGGKLQLTLNTVYYLSQPVENIPYDYYLEFKPTAERQRTSRAERKTRKAVIRRTDSASFGSVPATLSSHAFCPSPSTSKSAAWDSAANAFSQTSLSPSKSRSRPGDCAAAESTLMVK